ncbi:MAG: 4Fe-4S binding protein [Phycisphaerales bacterium]
MIKALISRIKQGYRTYPFPAKEPVLPERFKGRPIIHNDKCDNCRKCSVACPVNAIIFENAGITIDLGKCVFCGQCQEVCSKGCIEFSKDYRLAATDRQDLLVNEKERKLAAALNKESQKIFGHSLKLRQVSAGGCNACEADTNVLGTLVFDLGRFGIQFVASPRHADGILVTGPVTNNMKEALRKTYDAVPAPKFVIAVGACAISGGIYNGHSEVNNGVNDIKIDLYIPGCPPHPYTILDGLITFLGRRS